eukprot:GFUD01135041.1.p1 GENE.GFUD01135041.1~~GFUD01135041.1.p1  ORF type:complete len:127 (-),score=29.63 GFUD01135041.1:54-434(-)
MSEDIKEEAINGRKTRRLSGEGKYLYSLFGLERGAQEKDIKKAYRDLSRKFHPDKNVGASNHQENADKMAELGQANAILSDPTKKEIYDKWGSKGIVAANMLGGLDRVNRVTMGLCKVFRAFPNEI